LFFHSISYYHFGRPIYLTLFFLYSVQDDGAFALAQALKANEDLAVTSLNLSNNFFTKFGQVSLVCFHLAMIM
jgi:hypothetical protein